MAGSGGVHVGGARFKTLASRPFGPCGPSGTRGGEGTHSGPFGPSVPCAKCTHSGPFGPSAPRVAVSAPPVGPERTNQRHECRFQCWVDCRSWTGGPQLASLGQTVGAICAHLPPWDTWVFVYLVLIWLRIFLDDKNSSFFFKLHLRG